MKVEFTIDEVLAMANSVLDGLSEEQFSRGDVAAIRRWRNEHLTARSDEMARLTEKVNEEVQRTHDHSMKSGIQKPDWV
ncbi:MAG: hypothetical protein F4Z60_00355 [Chloroflexi bacterium]|nr:hypothetical protein [Chloroflexota bacterium]